MMVLIIISQATVVSSLVFAARAWRAAFDGNRGPPTVSFVICRPVYSRPSLVVLLSIRLPQQIAQADCQQYEPQHQTNPAKQTHCLP